jgi:hypothetical protein
MIIQDILVEKKLRLTNNRSQSKILCFLVICFRESEITSFLSVLIITQQKPSSGSCPNKTDSLLMRPSIGSILI